VLDTKRYSSGRYLQIAEDVASKLLYFPEESQLSIDRTVVSNPILEPFLNNPIIGSFNWSAVTVIPRLYESLIGAMQWVLERQMISIKDRALLAELKAFTRRNPLKATDLDAWRERPKDDQVAAVSLATYCAINDLLG
jgi:hypothetical protein